MKIANANTSLVNGPGIRLVIYFSGCNHKCNGCFNPELQDFNNGKEVTSSQLQRILKKEINSKYYDGLTLTGGDPMYYAEEIADALKGVKTNIWCWTGYKYEDIKDKLPYSKLLKYIDTLIDGPYIKDKKCGHKYYGSSNQRIIHLK